MSMFCYQCEQTAKGRGCDYLGVCGKTPETAAIQDVIVYQAKGIAMFAHRARKLGASLSPIDTTLVDALFYTVTNVNFDAEFLAGYARQLNQVLTTVKTLYADTCRKSGQKPEELGGPATFSAAATIPEIVKQADLLSILKSTAKHGAELAGVMELLLYGLKGTAAYAHHAQVLGVQCAEFESFASEALAYLGADAPKLDELLPLCLRCGEQNYKVMELLDRAHTDRFGHPQPTPVRVTPLKGKAILVSGHDLHDLESLLQATEGTDIHVYTHGEMLPAHGYPGLKKYKHLAGNYGTAWQNQAKEFDDFPGAILMTTNCIQEPRTSYARRIFTTGLVGWPGVTHVANGHWKPVIDAALASPGFAADAPEQTILVGFGHQAVLGVADKVIGAVKAGAIKRFFLIGGCDGAKPGRDYYTQLAEKLPKDTVILTLACGKYRFNMQDFGTIGGIPRLLDIGQCNDAYSAIRIAAALADAFKTDVNHLPLSLVLSWYEQKAVAILLTLLHLGIKNIRIGPSLPAFVSPQVLKVLVDTFELKPIGTVEEDMRAMLAS